MRAPNDTVGMNPLVVRARNPTTSASVANTIALPAVWWATSSAAGSVWPPASLRLKATSQWIELSTESPIETAAIIAVPMLIRWPHQPISPRTTKIGRALGTSATVASRRLWKERARRRKIPTAAIRKVDH